MKTFKELSEEQKKKDEYWTRLETDKALHRNGVIASRAREEMRSLTYEERQIMSAIRMMARHFGFSQRIINIIEMEGASNKELVYEPYRVTVKFAYYQSPYYGHSVAEPSYIVVKSNHPVLILHGNFGLEELKKYDVKIPCTPTYEKWVKSGRRCFRG